MNKKLVLILMIGLLILIVACQPEQTTNAYPTGTAAVGSGCGV
tara:strand:- start:630 stop:758 length:129 start_codon:yes stop_codon:yes gene_type:complete